MSSVIAEGQASSLPASGFLSPPRAEELTVASEKLSFVQPFIQQSLSMPALW